jgi:hypothetical protein
MTKENDATEKKQDEIITEYTLQSWEKIEISEPLAEHMLRQQYIMYEGATIQEWEKTKIFMNKSLDATKYIVSALTGKTINETLKRNRYDYESIHSIIENNDRIRKKKLEQ